MPRLDAASVRLHRLLLIPAPGRPGVILTVTAGCLVWGICALFAWLLTYDDAWVIGFFHIPAALAMVWLAGTQFWLATQAARRFGPHEAMRKAWTWIAFSAGCDLFGAAATQVFGVDSAINPLRAFPWWHADAAMTAWREAGAMMGGTLRFAFLASGLWYAVRVYRRAGFLGKLKWSDRALLIAFLLYMADVVRGVTVAFRAGKPWRWTEAAGWPTDPLLWLLLLEALLLYRSAQRMGPGWIGRCWKTLSIAVFLTALGDAGTWAYNYGYIPYPWNSLIWYVWLPAAAAYALAPAYQLEAIQRAAEPF